ncbi:MAG: 4Fe-4S binding protein, partial [Raoultibacter sp.]
NGRPLWSNTCTHCMACIARCPEEAIEFKHKTQGKARHYLEE